MRRGAIWILGTVVGLLGGTASPVSMGAPTVPGPDRLIQETDALFRSESGGRRLAWYHDLENALGVAGEEYKPLVVFFHSPADGWSTRMRAQILSDTAVAAQLEHYVRVEVAIEDDADAAARYLVRGIPAVRILSAEGRMLQGRDGFVTAPEMVRMLRGALNAEFLKQSDPEFQELIDQLELNEVEPDAWAGIMVQLGESQKRKTVRDLILKLDPFPKRRIVDLLAHPRLSVRLGAIELLEELSGDNFGFDPWTGGAESTENKTALENWSRWVDDSGSDKVDTVYSILSDEQISGYIRDIIGENRQRALRARGMLRSGGENAARSLGRFLENNPALPEPEKNRAREVLYSLTMPPVGGNDPDTLAHRLVYGNLDSKLDAISLLKESGRSSLPVLLDFLQHPDPLVRETSADAALAAGSAAAIPAIEEHLAKETEDAVIMAVLRTIGVDEIEAGADLVAGFADREEEDLAIMALESLGALRAKEHADVILAQLENDRWRVRVTALETVGKLKESHHAKKVRPLLRDEDEFVRVAAIQTVASLGDTGATKELTKLYREHEDVRAPVIGALISLKQSLPKTLREDLAKGDPDTVLAIIDTVGKAGERHLDVLGNLVHHDNLDVACAALRQIAAKGLSTPENQAMIADVLREGHPEKSLAALESIRLDARHYSAYRRQLSPATEENESAPPLVEEIFDVFLDRQAKDGSDDPLMTLFSSVEPYLSERSDESFRHAAALVLAKAGHGRAIDFLTSGMENRSISQRSEVAKSLYDAPIGALPVLISLMRDRSDEVRREAATSALRHENSVAYVEAVFDELTRPATRLKPWDVDLSYVDDAFEEGATRRRANERARSILELSLDPALKSFAALVLRYAWNYGDEQFLLPLTSAEEPHLRRAAWHAIGRNNPSFFREHISSVAEDPSEKVRSVPPYLLSENGRYFLHYFDATHSQRFYDYDRASYSNTRYLDPESRKVLLKLFEDPEPAVRIDSAFALMANGEKIEPGKLKSILASFPDRDSAERRVGEYLESNYQSLDRSYGFLLNHVDAPSISSRTMERINAHFRSGADPGNDDYDFVARDGHSAAPSTTFPPTENPETPNASPGGGTAVELVYFYNPGCKECDRAEKYIDEMRSAFPRLVVERRNIRDSDSAILNEALSEKLGVPEKIRMVTPAVFTGDGYLIKDDILPVQLGELVTRASSTGSSPGGWSSLGASEIAAADAAIEGRFSSAGLAVILAAGFLDGINPCAFATIILFLSYLQIARHGPRQILMVGGAFVTAVFLTYFLLGLGLVEVVSRLQFLKGVAVALNLGLAAFALVIMVLSLRDGFLCLQGRLADTTLQLPFSIKERIRRVARTGARHRRFVVAAFISGVVISVLELACTGQVYLPTINYMVQEGRSSAYFYLTLYNFAFIVPLLAVFTLSFFGLRSDELIEFQRRHSAAIKFLTAGLFLALATLLVYQIVR
ncbi:MAG: HEAT repeat domain-containing protein [Verrucomicrobiales bacterium]